MGDSDHQALQYFQGTDELESARKWLLTDQSFAARFLEAQDSLRFQMSRVSDLERESLEKSHRISQMESCFVHLQMDMAKLVDQHRKRCEAATERERSKVRRIKEKAGKEKEEQPAPARPTPPPLMNLSSCDNDTSRESSSQQNQSPRGSGISRESSSHQNQSPRGSGISRESSSPCQCKTMASVLSSKNKEICALKKALGEKAAKIKSLLDQIKKRGGGLG